MPSTELFDPSSNDPSAPPDGPPWTEKYRPGLGGSLLASTSASASDYDRKEVWVEVFTKLKETRIVPDHSGFKSKFSVSCKLLPMVKQSYPDAPFVIDELGRVVLPAGFATASWKDAAYEAMKEVFGFVAFTENHSAKNEHGRSLGKCIPNFMPMDEGPPPQQMAIMPANQSSARRKPISLLQDLPAELLGVIATLYDLDEPPDVESTGRTILESTGHEFLLRIFVLGLVSNRMRSILREVRPIVRTEDWREAAHIEQSGMWHVGKLCLYLQGPNQPRLQFPPVQYYSKLHTIEGFLRSGEDLANIASFVQNTHAPLRTLRLCFDDDIRRLAPVEHLTDVSSFTIVTAERLRDISVVGSFPNLHSLTIEDCQRLRDISAVARCPALRSISLDMLLTLADISPIANCPELQTLIIDSLPFLTDISAVANLTQLRDVKLSRCRRLKDISAFANCPNLRSFNDLNNLNIRVRRFTNSRYPDWPGFVGRMDLEGTLRSHWKKLKKKERAEEASLRNHVAQVAS